MATDVTMPRLSDSMEEGTIVKWLVEKGGEVKRGEPLVEIETDKANMTYDADTDGVLIEVVVSEGDTVALGEVIARVGEEQEAGGGRREDGDSGDGSRESGEAESGDRSPESGEDESSDSDSDSDPDPDAGAAARLR